MEKKNFKSMFILVLCLVLGTALFTACDTMNDSEGAGADYALTLSKNETKLDEEHTFPAAYPDYEDVAELEVTVTNAGPGIAAGIEISLSGEGAGAFTLSPELIESLEPGKAAPFTVKPVAGLTGGDYRATVTVRDGAKDIASFEVVFAVSTTPLYGIRLDVAEEGHSFPPKAVDYGKPEALTVTVTNIGNEVTGELIIALEGENPSDYTLNPASIPNIAAGGTETFTVQPVSALAEGTYTATVTVSGGNDIAAEFPVSYQVFAELIEINTVADLAAIGNTSPADGNYILMKNLVLEEWTPVTNTKEAPFTGVFMGNDKTLTITSYDPAVLNTDPAKRLKGYIGVFGYIQGGRVENLIVDLQMPDEQKISNAEPGLGKDQFIGGVSGYAVDTEFEGIKVLGAINLSKGDAGAIYLGGVTGYLEGGSISGSNFQAKLTSQEPYSQGSGPAYAAGLAGKVKSAEIRESSVSGAIIAYADRGTAFAGGAAGYSDSTHLYRIAVSAAVDAGVSKVFGGISTFTNFAYAGGITAVIGGNDSGNLPEIRECYSTGNVTATSYAPMVGCNTVYAGGIVGVSGGWSLQALITDCYSRGNVSAMTDPNYSGAHSFFSVGGIVGEASCVTVQNSYAAGTITADSNQPEGNFTHAGGIAAILEGNPNFADGTITIQNCAALSPRINWRLYTGDNMILNRIAIRGKGTTWIGIKDGTLDIEQYPENTTLSNNIANEDMVINYDPSPQQAAKVPAIILDPGPDTEDGADCVAMPAQIVYEKNLGWNFATVWKMGSDGYPALQWQK